MWRRSNACELAPTLAPIEINSSTLESSTAGPDSKGALVPQEFVDPRREQLNRLITDHSCGCDSVGEFRVREAGRATGCDVVLDAGAAVAADARSDRRELLVPLLELHHPLLDVTGMQPMTYAMHPRAG
jgi:hypothetical protein